MSKEMKQTFKMTALVASLLAVCGPALAEGPESSVSVGVGNWSNDRPQRGIYDGMRDSGGYGLLDADILKRDDTTGTWLGLKARNLGLDNREIKGEWLRQGNIGASLEYSRVSRDQPFIYNTGLQGIGTTTLRVPTPSIVPGTGTNVELGTTRDRLTGKFFKNLGVGLNFNVSFRNETKEGTRGWGRGGAAEFAVEPIDSTIRLLEATLNYSREGLQLSGGYYGTQYDNANAMVTTSLTSGASPYFLSLPLDNQSHELFLNGGYNFTPTTRGTFKLSYSRATQDEGLGNFGGTASPLAPTNLDGRLDTTLLEAGLTARPMPKLSIVANLRYRDFADKTPVRGIVFNAGGTPTVFNTPFSYTNTTGKLEATYRLPQALSLLGGIEYREQDRQAPNVGTLWVPFRTSLDETTYNLQLRRSLSETVNGSLAYLHSKRDGSTYVLPGDPNEDLINPLNIADRKRDKLRVMLDWSPTDRASLQFALEDSRDKYSGNPYGLQKGSGRLYSVDASYQLSSDWQIHAWVSRDETKAREITQRDGANANPARDSGAVAEADKHTDLIETGDSLGFGVRGKVSGRLKVGGDVESFRSVNEYKQSLTLLDGRPRYQSTIAAGTTIVPTPDITNTLLRFKLYAQYAVQKNADVRVNVIHEKWSTDDWSWMMFPASGATPFAFGTTTDGTTVTAAPKQNSTFVGIRYLYRFQ